MQNRLRTGYRILTCFSAIFGIITTFFADRIVVGSLYLFTFFTIQSNVFVFIFLLYKLIRVDGKKSDTPVLHGALTLYILITGIVFNTMLAPLFDATGFDLFNMHITHTITPLLFFGDFLFNRKRGKLKWRHLPLWLIYPIVYLIESSIEGAITGMFRYPFLDFINQPAVNYIIQLVIVISAFIIVSVILITIDRLQIRKNPPSDTASITA